MSDYWPRSSGMVCFAGDRVVPDSLLHGARSLDIAPTVLTWCGLPAGLDMPGRVLIEAFGTPSRIPRTETWEAPATDSVNDDPSAGKIIHELEALGYTDPLAAQALRRSDETARERDLNLAWVHLAAGRGEAALELLEPLAGERTALLPYIAYACLMCGRGEDARTALERATQSGAAQSLVGLVRAYMLLLDGRNREAMHQLAEVEKASGVGPFESCLAGDLYRHARRTKDAERCYRAALERDPDCPSAHLGLAQTFLLDSDNQQAAQAALQAIGLKYDLAPAHLTLGVALARLGMEARAEAAFAICLKLEPDNLVAKEWVALLERRRGASK